MRAIAKALCFTVLILGAIAAEGLFSIFCALGAGLTLISVIEDERRDP